MIRSQYHYYICPDYVLIVDKNNGGKSVTNDAENVITDLAKLRYLKGHETVYYIDSEKDIDEIRYSLNDEKCETVTFHFVDHFIKDDIKQEFPQYFG